MNESQFWIKFEQKICKKCYSNQLKSEIFQKTNEVITSFYRNEKLAHLSFLLIQTMGMFVQYMDA